MRSQQEVKVGKIEIFSYKNSYEEESSSSQ
jgi:hypothetical protein